MPQTKTASVLPTPNTAAPRGRWEPRPFMLVSVEKTDAPQGGADDTWYNYTLDNGRSKIVGTHRGSLKAVTVYANQYAAELNTRTISGHSAWAPRSKKPAAPAAT